MRRNKRKLKYKSSKMFDSEDIKAYMQMPAKDKLYWLEKMKKFLNRITPAQNNEVWEKLRDKGF
ncbi:MAG: hypothetical protein AAB257_00720 [Nitrospinota bacterium]